MLSAMVKETCPTFILKIAELTTLIFCEFFPPENSLYSNGKYFTEFYI